MKANCASAAMFSAEDRSVRCAAAEMASGKIALVPKPIAANPASDSSGQGEMTTIAQPTSSAVNSTRARLAGEVRSTTPSAKKAHPALCYGKTGHRDALPELIRAKCVAHVDGGPVHAGAFQQHGRDCHNNK